MADGVKEFISNLQKPFEGLRFKQTETVGKLFDLISNIGQFQQKQIEAIDSANAALVAPAAMVKGVEEAEDIGEPITQEPKTPEEVPTVVPEEAEKPADEESKSLLKSLIGATRTGLTDVGAKVAEGTEPLKTQAEDIGNTVTESMLGPLSGIATSLKDIGLSTIKNTGLFLKDRFDQFRTWRRERKEAAKAEKQRGKTNKLLSNLLKFQKGKAFLGAFAGIGSKILDFATTIGASVANIASDLLSGLKYLLPVAATAIGSVLGTAVTKALPGILKALGLIGIGASLAKLATNWSKFVKSISLEADPAQQKKNQIQQEISTEANVKASEAGEKLLDEIMETKGERLLPAVAPTTEPAKPAADLFGDMNTLQEKTLEELKIGNSNSEKNLKLLDDMLQSIRGNVPQVNNSLINAPNVSSVSQSASTVNGNGGMNGSSEFTDRNRSTNLFAGSN